MSCVSFFLFSAGCSNTARSTVQNNISNRIQTTVLNRNLTNISNIAQNYNKFELKAREVNCNLTVEQKITANMKVFNDITTQQAAEVKQELKEIMTADVNTIAKNDPDLFQALFGKASNQSSISEVVNNLSTALDTSITNETIVNAINSVVNRNDLKINVDVLNGDECRFNQNVIAEIQMSNLIRSVQQSLSESAVFREIDQRVRTAAESGGGNAGLFKVLIVILIIVAILAAVYYFFFRKPGGAAGAGVSLYQLGMQPQPQQPYPYGGYGYQPQQPSPYGYQAQPQQPSPYGYQAQPQQSTGYAQAQPQYQYQQVPAAAAPYAQAAQTAYRYASQYAQQQPAAQYVQPQTQTQPTAYVPPTQQVSIAQTGAQTPPAAGQAFQVPQTFFY